MQPSFTPGCRLAKNLLRATAQKHVLLSSVAFPEE